MEDQEHFRVEQYLYFFGGARGLAKSYNYDGRTSRLPSICYK